MLFTAKDTKGTKAAWVMKRAFAQIKQTKQIGCVSQVWTRFRMLATCYLILSTPPSNLPPCMVNCYS